MFDKNHDKFLEELLEASLRLYRSEEPRAGLENRILASVRASHHTRQLRRWVWALAASAAVLIVVVVVLHFTPRPPPRTATVSPPPQAVAPKVELPPLVAATPPVTRVPRKPVQRPQTTTARLRRPEQFPTPSPLTDEERLLLVYGTEGPSKKAQADQHQEEPFEISPISIARLKIEPMPGLAQ